MKSATATGPWIDPKKERPKDKETVLVQLKTGMFRTMTYRSDGVGLWWGGGIHQTDVVKRFARINP